jgi:hypothetical protein
VPAEKERKVFFDLTCGEEIPVSLFEFELRALFEEATVKSGCKWWSMHSRPSRAEKNVSRALHSMTFVCRHYEKGYEKQEVDNTRTSRHLLRCGCAAACTMKVVSVRTHMLSKGSCLIYFKVDEYNRGHGHLVVCSSKQLVQQGKLCDAILRQCHEASRCLRKMDVSSCVSVFEFADAATAEAMLCQSLANIKMKKAQAYYWLVQSLDSQHVGHSEPYRECEKNLYLTYAMKLTAKAMADSGVSASDIADYLSSRGCSGTLTCAASGLSQRVSAGKR